MLKKTYPYMNESFLKKNYIYSNSLARFSFPYYALSRGLTVSWINIRGKEKYKSYYKVEGVGGFYTIKGYGKEYSFNFSRVLNQSQDDTVIQKNRLGLLLDGLGVKYPKHAMIKKDDGAEGLNGLTYPIVIKPISGSMGEGVYPNICSDEELEYALSRQSSGIMAEEHIVGDEYRVYVLNGEPIAYCKRHAPMINGDGISSIRELVVQFNEEKVSQGLVQVKMNDDLDRVLLSQEKNLDHILLLGETVMLSYKQGRSSGSTIETVGFINYKAYENLRSIGKYLDNFCLIGIDCIVKNDELYVLEINLRPQISSALIPDKGVAINIPKLVIDSLFGAYKGDYLTPENFTNKLKKIDKLMELDWKEMVYCCQKGFSLSI